MCDHFKQENVKKHFTHKNHDGFISEASITFIDKRDSSDPSKREQYQILTLKNIVKHGLIIAESV